MEHEFPGLTPSALREIEALKQIRGPRQVESILTIHQRKDSGACLCGWDKLGSTHAGHQADKLREAGLIKDD